VGLGPFRSGGLVLFIQASPTQNFSNNPKDFQFDSNVQTSKIQIMTIRMSKKFQNWHGGRKIQMEQVPFLPQLPNPFGF
jgi:hypothetical protein